MKQNRWKLLVVVVLVAAVAGVVAIKNRGADKVPAATVENNVAATSDDKPAVGAETGSSDTGKPRMTEPSTETKEAETQTADTASAGKGEEKPKTNNAAANPAVRRPEAALVRIEEPKPQEQTRVEVAKKTEKDALLPKLIDLGADKCIPCKMMAAVLEELSKEYKGKLQVVFIDVWKNSKAGDAYGVQTIPTQILYDTKGKEFFRHTGFYPKDEILAKFKEHGIHLSK